MVRGLAAFVEKNFRGWKTIRPKGPLIIDGYSLCHELYLHSGADNVHGGDYVSFSQYIVKFLNTLLQNQIKPYVVFDGIDAEQAKKETHDKRRGENAERVQNLLRGTQHSSRADYYLPYLARLVMMEATVRVLGEENLYVADGDADSIIATLAITRRCPVLSIDSDFYIFPISEGYIPFTEMKWGENGVHARIYYYTDFAKQYGIRDPQLLIMLPAILGDSMLQPLNDALEVLTKATRIRAEAVLKYASKFSLFEDCKNDITSISRRNPLDNVEAANKTYYSSVENFPSDGTTTLKVKDSRQPIPKLILGRFRKGKLPTLLMDAMCRGEVDHRIAVEDMSGPWCHEIGVPIREITYGVICGNHGSIAEHHRREGKVNEFPLIRVRAKMPSQFHCADAPILDAQYQNDTSKYGEQIMMAILKAPGEFRRLGIPDEFWFFYAVTRYWYMYVTTRVNKDVLLKAIILSAIKCLKAQDEDFPAVQALPNPPDAALVHALAQWQSIYYDLYCLNQLLLEPLTSLQVSLVLECSNVVKFYSVLLRTSSGGELIRQMGLGDVDKNIYRSLYGEIKKS